MKKTIKEIKKAMQYKLLAEYLKNNKPKHKPIL